MAESNDLKKFLTKSASAVLVAIICQTGSFLWWAGRIDARMTSVEQKLINLEHRMDNVEQAVRSIETSVNLIVHRVDDLESVK